MATPSSSWLVAAVVASLFSVGCSRYAVGVPAHPVVGPLGGAPADAAKVCVARTAVVARAVLAVVRDNGHLVGATHGATHFCYLAAPGTHVVSSEADNVLSTEVVLAAGQTLYFDQKYVFSWQFADFRLIAVPEREGLELMAQSQHETLRKTPKHEPIMPPTFVFPAQGQPAVASVEPL
jgi:hypothetical protein